MSADFGEKLTDEEVDEGIREMDVGGGGQIDAGEFVERIVVRRAGRCGKRTGTEEDVQSPGLSERTNCFKQVMIENVEGSDEFLDPRKIHTVVTHATTAAAREQEIQLSTERVQHQQSNQVMQEKTGKREREKGERGKKEEGELGKKGTRRSRRTLWVGGQVQCPKHQASGCRGPSGSQGSQRFAPRSATVGSRLSSPLNDNWKIFQYGYCDEFLKLLPFTFTAKCNDLTKDPARTKNGGIS